ncbi:MAG: zinc ribbon domain-containing protein, partial [Oscillospiraceae bacterium]|nr:zinc ribbon domain-containing protein [Oscillospiraceae bacterium]
NILVKTIEDIDLCSLEVIDESGKKVHLDEYIYNNYIDDERITVQNVDNVLNDPFIKDFIIEKIEGYQNFCMDEGDMVYITSDDVVNLIDENSNLLFNEAGLNFLEPDKEQLRNDLRVLDDFKDFSDNYLTGWFSSGLIHTFFSFANVVFLAVFMAVILIQWIMVYKLNARRIGRVLRKYSVVLIVPSFLIFASTFSFLFLEKSSILNTLTSDLKWSFTISSGIIFAIGVVLLLISIPMNLKNRNKGAIELSSGITENLVDEQPVYAAVSQNNETTEDNNTIPDSVNTDDGLCPQCGHQNKIGSSFCSRCGTKLK